uniref:Uncharacterized protein n=1 Tax=Arundo donax TaxID=35708 RepID=A0A0A8Y4Q0_ARUDO
MSFKDVCVYVNWG